MVRAATLVAPRTIEVLDYARPELPAPGWGWLRVEACGMCGTDVEQFEGNFTGSAWPAGPMIPGHEIVGVIEELPDETSARWGVAVGDRVAIEPSIPCGSCPPCLTGEYVSCRGWPTRPLAYGFVPTSEAPTLWGGWSEMMALHPLTVVHRVPDGLEPGTATLFNALGTAFEWTVRRSGLQVGHDVLILGAGQRGLAAVVAARAAGAGRIFVSGTHRDKKRLIHAEALGAEVTVDVEADDLESVVKDATQGRGVDVVVDTSAGAVEPIAQAIASVADGGTIVLGGLKGGRLAGVDVDAVVLRAIRLQGARSAGWHAYDMALRELAKNPTLGDLRTHVFGLEGAADAVAVLAGDDPDRVYVGVDALA
ncbi:MAG: threonine dehydrogenase-like Zn-dependent dehydrogenase [Candidatus Aldehydirespiratoraceae bacterium]|jgi:threonine dehydrogenase-like Zn-dependent dehydrogenase